MFPPYNLITMHPCIIFTLAFSAMQSLKVGARKMSFGYHDYYG